MHDPRLSFATLSATATPVSPSDLSGEHAVDLSGIISGRRFDMDGMRRQTPLRWMTFLHAHFPDHSTVGWMFGVDDRTARNWWHGKHEPRLSAFLSLVQTAKPEARAMIVGFMLEAA